MATSTGSRSEVWNTIARRARDDRGVDSCVSYDPFRPLPAGEAAMKTLIEYLFSRPLSGCLQGLIIGIFLPFALASKVEEKAGRGWSLILYPVCMVLVVVTVPLAVIYSLVMTIAKGPYWHYPLDKRVYSAPPE
jgi:hypothetical protein